MCNQVIRNAIVAAVLGGVFGTLAHLLLDVKRADDEHAGWAVRTVYHYLRQLPDGPRRGLTRALFTS